MHSIQAELDNYLFNSPVIVFEPWSPIWSPEQSLQCASQVDESVTHQEEH